MHVYTLTGITGRAASERRTVTFATFDWKPKVLLVVSLSIVPALLVVGMMWPLFGEWAVAGGVAVVGGSVWLFMSRTRDSRNISRFQDARDRWDARADLGKFFVLGTRVDPLMSEWLTVAPGSRAVEREGATTWP